MISKRSLFIFVAVGVLFFGLIVGLAARTQGWFAPHDYYNVKVDSADGLNGGTAVFMSGLKVGQVQNVDFQDGNQIVMHLKVQSRYADRIRKDSKISVGRPFIIGEKAVSISPGSPNAEIVPPDSTLVAEKSMELTDLLSGGTLTPYITTFTRLLDQLKIVVEGDGTPQGVNLLKVYAQAYTSLKAIESLSTDVHSVRKDFLQSSDMKSLVKNASGASQDIQPLMAELNKAVPALTQLSQQLTVMMPEMARTLSETATTMAALQRSFILRGAVADLKEEEAKKKPSVTPESESDRRPASSDSR
jgi:phospholipid/cholesterol/gamma-HCH transport system substrate-binding protein